MSVQYDEYLRDHRTNVKKGIDWMIDHGMINGLPCMIEKLKIQVGMHDASKFMQDEYQAYDDYFYGKEGKDEDDIEVIDSAFDYAWLHHIHYNPHHWQYWVLIYDEGNTNYKALEMPPEFVLEMIADWWSFSWKNENLYEIFDWYGKHREKMILHAKTRKAVEDILKEIREILDREKESEVQA